MQNSEFTRGLSIRSLAQSFDAFFANGGSRSPSEARTRETLSIFRLLTPISCRASWTELASTGPCPQRQASIHVRTQVRTQLNVRIRFRQSAAMLYLHDTRNLYRDLRSHGGYDREEEHSGAGQRGDGVLGDRWMDHRRLADRRLAEAAASRPAKDDIWREAVCGEMGGINH